MSEKPSPAVVSVADGDSALADAFSNKCVQCSNTTCKARQSIIAAMPPEVQAEIKRQDAERKADYETTSEEIVENADAANDQADPSI